MKKNNKNKFETFDKKETYLIKRKSLVKPTSKNIIKLFRHTQTFYNALRNSETN